jgi:hypothetical protein
MKRPTAVPTLLIATLLGCGPDGGSRSGPTAPVDPPPPLRSAGEAYGDVDVRTRTSGTGLDPDGYLLRVDGYWDYTGVPIVNIATNGRALIRKVPAGAHTLNLEHVSADCTGEQTTGINVVADSVITVEFQLVCAGVDPPPPIRIWKHRGGPGAPRPRWTASRPK